MNSDSQPTPQDVLDFIGDGTERMTDIKTDKGTETVLVRDHKIIGYMTQNVNSIYYGDFISEAENLLLLAEETKYNMSEPMAESLKKAIQGRVQAWGYGINAKSSETLRDAHNAKSNFTGMFIKDRKERIVTLKDEAKKGVMEGLGFGDKEDKRD